MPAKSDAGIHALQAYWKQRQLLKAKRLSKGKPKYSDEKIMKATEYEAYVDRFLRLEDDNDPSLDQTKIAKDMLALKLKHAQVEPTTVQIDLSGMLDDIQEPTE